MMMEYNHTHSSMKPLCAPRHPPSNDNNDFYILINCLIFTKTKNSK